MTDIAFIDAKLDDIIAYLKAARLWSETQPEPSALASREPFAIDTLSFEQWLQFIYLPGIREHVQLHQQLPADMAVAPMAHEAYGQEHMPLVHLLMVLDNLSKIR
ncbi:YqcC family protein [Salinimonas lutimaris]|uniref:YqcC family protein n=1 Tax=Salinimonas lutimaris TaxID=914153 RepID=UPI001586BB64|nr:YqcC family protein [Salinimonas lutimaris]